MGDQQEPWVEIGASTAGRWVSCHVTDNGIGIDASHHDRIFGLFNRVGASAGAGVGLAIVKPIIDEHGGQIRVHSEGPGSGTSFRFTLPAAADTG